MERIIDTRHRLGLAAKGGLLLSLGLVLMGIALAMLLRDDWNLIVRTVAALLFCFIGAFPASFSRAAFADAFSGRAVTITGAIALKTRKAGHSLKLPGGGFAEYLLFNEWEELTADRAYTVVIGARSKVIVERPQPTLST